MINFQSVTPEHLEGLTKLMQTCFPSNTHINQHAISWAFFHQRFNHQLISWIATEGKNVASHYGNQWHPTQQNGMMIPSFLCLDMATEPTYRSKGLVSQLSKRVYDQVSKTSAPFTIGFSNKYGINVDRHASSYGYQIVGQFMDYIALPYWSKKIILSYSHELGINPGQPANFYSIYKPPEYLRWRYLEKPYRPYTILRFDTPQHNGFLVLKQSKRFIDLLDIVLSEYTVSSVKTALLASRLLVFKQRKIGVTLKTFRNSLIELALKQSGYFALPPQFQTQPYWLTIKFHNQEFTSALTPNCWWLMGGDIL